MASPTRSIKHGLDRVLASLATVVAAPAFVLIAAAIKIDDRGPVFFRQWRLGEEGQPFELVKFRSMVVDADDLLDAEGKPTGRRVTRVGAVLRRWSLDELPQLFNIIAGDMSIVGPRPALVEHLERYSPEQRGRLRFRPGLTGLAQISGRNSLKWSERINLDNEYIDGFSLTGDLKIVLRTVRVVLTASGRSEDRNPGDADDLGPPAAEV